MGRPTSPKERRRQEQQARSQAQQAADQARRKKRLLGIVGLVVVLGLVLSTVAAVIAGSDGATTSRTSPSGTPTSDAPASTASTTLPTGAAEMPEVAPGATLTDATPCPAEDGSSPRTTQFAGPPPTCIDLTRNYQAVVHTNVGDLTLHLSTAQAPGAVNNFVVLARYHYFDGQAFAPIIKRTMAVMSPTFVGSSSSPGYSLPSEVPPQGQMRGPYTVSALPVDSSGAFDAAFFITTFSNAPDTDAEPTTFGLVLDGEATVKALDQAGSEEGSPSSAIVITGIEISPSTPVS